MDPENRSRLLGCCAKQCADTGVLASYLKISRTVNGDRDLFYTRLNELGNVHSEVLVPHREYRICFPACTCDLHTACGVNTPLLCECSRLSILYVGETVWKGCRLSVQTEGTILSGSPECCFRIVFEE